VGESPEATIKGEESAIIPSPPEGEGKGEGVFTIKRLLIRKEEICLTMLY
jgi:hypothetical protein